MDNEQRPPCKMVKTHERSISKHDSDLGKKLNYLKGDKLMESSIGEVFLKVSLAPLSTGNELLPGQSKKQT